MSRICVNPPAAYIVHLSAVRFREIAIPLVSSALIPFEPVANAEYNA